MFVPLHVRLSDVDSARIDETGNVKVVLRHRRDITLPLSADEARKLVDKLNELIPAAKARELERAYRYYNLGKGGHKSSGRDYFKSSGRTRR